MRGALTSLVLVFLCSCTFTNKDGNLAVGGKGAARGAGWAVAWDNVENMNNALVAGTIVAGGYISAGVEKGKQAVDRTAIHSNERVTIGAQGVEKFGIGEETKKFIHSTPNPNVLPK